MKLFMTTDAVPLALPVSVVTVTASETFSADNVAASLAANEGTMGRGGLKVAVPRLVIANTAPLALSGTTELFFEFPLLTNIGFKSFAMSIVPRKPQLKGISFVMTSIFVRSVCVIDGLMAKSTLPLQRSTGLSDEGEPF